MLLLLQQMIQVVALGLQPFAFCLAFAATQGVGVVAMGDREDGEFSGTGDADIAWIDGGGQAGEHQCAHASRHNRGGGALDLCTLSVHGHVVYGVADFLFNRFGGLAGEGDENHEEQGEDNPESHGVEGLGFCPLRSNRRAKIVELGVMRPALLPLLAMVSLAFSADSAHAQKIFSVDYESRADVKVFVVDYESRADLLVFKEDHESRADGNDGHWFFVKHESRADKTIFFVDYESRADLKIFFVDHESRAGWKNKSKQHLLF